MDPHQENPPSRPRRDDVALISMMLASILSWFSRPWWLLLAVIPPVIALARLLRVPERSRVLRFPASSWVPQRVQTKPSAGRSRIGLRTSALLLLVPLIAGFSGEAPRSAQADGWGLMLVLDISSSMTARDLGDETRLSIVREESRSLVSGLPLVHSGLVAFAGAAELVAPPTKEHDSLLEEISRVRPASFGEDGTAIGGGLAAAANALRRLPAGPGRILLVTDGVNNRGPVSPLDAASLASTLGVRIDVIGLGTSRLSRFLVPAAGGTTVEIEALLEIDDTVLSRVAEQTGGRYWRVRDRSQLSSAFREYRSLLPASERRRAADSSVSWPRYLAGAALALLALEVLLTEVILTEIPA